MNFYTFIGFDWTTNYHHCVFQENYFVYISIQHEILLLWIDFFCCMVSFSWIIEIFINKIFDCSKKKNEIKELNYISTNPTEYNFNLSCHIKLSVFLWCFSVLSVICLVFRTKRETSKRVALIRLVTAFLISVLFSIGWIIYQPVSYT